MCILKIPINDSVNEVPIPINNPVGESTEAEDGHLFLPRVLFLTLVLKKDNLNEHASSNNDPYIISQYCLDTVKVNNGESYEISYI